LIECTFDLQIEKVFFELKSFLVKNSCRIIVEKSPTLITVVQGSIWGVFPRAAKKEMRYQISAANSRNLVTVSSRLARDWMNLAVIGSMLATVLASICWWIALDLERFATTQQPSYWSWIVTGNGYASFQLAQTLAGFAMLLAVLLVVMIILEVVAVVFAKNRIDVFAEESLRAIV
jgi:hypothetical protein